MTEIGILLVVFLLLWVGGAVIIDVFIGVGFRRDRRPDPAEPRRPYQPSIADEAEGWLRER